MKRFSFVIAVLFTGCGLAMAQEPTKGRIYIGSVKDAPAWVWRFTNAFPNASQMASIDTQSSSRQRTLSEWTASGVCNRYKLYGAGIQVSSGS
jgi:hypothetical protein